MNIYLGQPYMAALPEALAIAVEHHMAGRLDSAEQIYRQILQVEPGHWDALQLLGALTGQRGQHAQAVEFLGAALRIREDQPIVHVNLGGAYFGLGNYPGAIACYRRALELKPDYAEAHYGLGLGEQAQGKLDER
jgi:protein O-GlcNAc transferase